MKAKYKAFGIIVIAAVVSVSSTQSALADGWAYSTDSNQGAHVVFTTVNDHFTVYDAAYDGWGAEGRLAYYLGGGGDCINQTGFNTSYTCGVVSGQSISYRACLEHNTGATVAYCSNSTADYS